MEGDRYETDFPIENIEPGRRYKISEEQKNILIDYLEKNPQLKSGRFTSNFTYKTAQNMWKDASLVLNAVGPAQKDWNQWRKTWQDLKQKVKIKARENKQNQHATGGGPCELLHLTALEEKTLSLVGQIPVFDQPQTINSSVTFNFDEPTIVQTPVTNHDYLSHTINVPSTSTTQLTDELTKPIQKKQSQLERTTKVPTVFVQQLDKKMEIKKNYYEKKLQLLQEDINEKRRIADALMQLANSHENIYCAK